MQVAAHLHNSLEVMFKRNDYTISFHILLSLKPLYENIFDIQDYNPPFISSGFVFTSNRQCRIENNV